MDTPAPMSDEMAEAVWHGDVETIKVLIDKGEDPNGIEQKSGRSGLMSSAENQQLGSMEQLIAAGADVNYALESGWTALHHAVDSECDGEAQTGVKADGKMVALLVSAGADPDAISSTQADENAPRATWQVNTRLLAAHLADSETAN